MKLLPCLKPAALCLAAAVLPAGCKTTQPPSAAPAAVVEYAITAAEMATVFAAAETGSGKLETGAKPAESAGNELTPPEVLRLAAEKNPSFAEYAASREAALAEVMAATAWKNPVLEAGFGRGKTRGSPSESGLEYSLGLFQPIEWPGKRGVRKQAAEAGVTVVELDEVLFRSTLRADVMRAYVTAEACDSDSLLMNALKQNADETRQLVDGQVAAGELNETARLPFRQAAALAEGALAVAGGEKKLAFGLLRRLCGGELPEGRLKPRDAAVDGINLETARELALKKHPAILKLEAEKRRCDLLVKQAELAKKPDFTPGLEASHGVDVLSWGARLGMELPFWDRNRAGIAAAKAERHRVEAQLAAKRLEVASGVEAAVLECANSAARMKAAMETATVARLAAESTGKMAAGGEVGRLAVLAAERERVLAEREFSREMLATMLARIQLEQAIGYGELK